MSRAGVKRALSFRAPAWRIVAAADVPHCNARCERAANARQRAGRIATEGGDEHAGAKNA
jgi:hypothetical protein